MLRRGLLVAVAATAAAQAAAPIDPRSLEALAAVVAAAGDRYTPRPVDVAAVTRRTRAPGAPAPAPTVLMHGLGDAGSNAGMQSLAQSVMAAHAGAYAVAVDVANTVQSFVTPIKLQIEELAAAIRADARLRGADEINLVGLSQGGLVVRGYAQRFAGTAPFYPRVKNLVSICGVQTGVFNCPAELQVVPFLCDVFEADPYHFLLNGSIPLSFSDYFVTYWNRTEFLTSPGDNALRTETPILPDLNNLRAGPNASYVSALASIKTLLLAEALQDTVVYPFQSEQFGGYAWTDAAGKAHPVTLEFDDPRNDQWAANPLGLRDLARGGSLVRANFTGDHIRAPAHGATQSARSAEGASAAGARACAPD
jgi:palmitoyl-protein thioesterase